MRLVEKFPVKDLVGWSENPRVHPPEEIRMLAASIERHGWGNPILAQEGTNRVIAGHGRIKAAKKQGLKAVPVVFLKITDEKADSLSVSDNKIAELSAWDDAKLEDLLVKFREEKIDLEALGFLNEEPVQDGDKVHVEFDARVNGKKREGLIEDDETPEPPKKPITEPGDLWILGRHRLFCGNVGLEEDIERLMAGNRYLALVTDPPYSSGGIHAGARRFTSNAKKYERKGNWKAKSASKREASYTDFSGDNRDQRSWTKWTTGWLEELAEYADDEAGAYAMVFIDWRQLPALTDAIQAARWTWRGVNVWDKGALCRLVHLNYFRSQCEFVVWATWGKFGANYEKGLTPIAGCLSYGLLSEKKKHDHIAQKPVGVMDWLVSILRDRPGIVLDPFAGSGTTLIACEKVGRPCYVMEIKPHFCDVIVRRWEEFTGQKAYREGSKDGAHQA